MADKEPQNIDRKYRIINEIGGGGFSEVYLVEGPGGECALKLLKEVQTEGGAAALQEFKNEFAVLKNLNHPHIAKILDFGFDDEAGRYYYTSEMIRGHTIYEATEASTVEEITDLIVQSLRALQYLHSFHIYHFDIKAANVLVLPQNQDTVKLIDFGLAGIDPRGRLIGTPSYMSPEIVSREAVDWRADLYSLGVLWYFCLARFNPFRSKEPRETLDNQLKMIPPPPSEFNERVPAWIDKIVMRMLEKNPAKRYSHASKILREINHFSPKKYPLETRETLVSYLPQEGELIGRADEMRRLEDDLKALADEDDRSRMTLVLGALGTGKTRYLREFKHEAQLNDVRVQLVSATDADAYKQWCEQLSKHLTDGEDLEVYILDDAEALSHVEASAQHLLGLISRARRPTGASRIMLIVAADAKAEEVFISSLQTIMTNPVQLKNFSPEDLTGYLASLTGLDEPPKDLIKGMYSRTEGNPLFVTEVLKALIAGGGLFDEGGRWRDTVFEDVGVDFSKVVIPSTVEELFLDRVKKLTPEEKTLLEALAVANQPSSGAQLIDYSKFDDPFPALGSLVKQELLERTEDHRFMFKNELLQSTLYASMDEERRTEYHDRIAACLEKEHAPSDQIMHHQSFGSNDALALKAAIELGDEYLQHGAGRIAIRYFKRATALIPGEDIEASVDVLIKLGIASLISKEIKEAERLFTRVEKQLPKLPETEHAAQLQVETLIRLGGTYLKMLAFDRARTAFTEAKVKLHTKVHDPVREVHVENFLGTVLMSEGRYREARELFERTRKAAQEFTVEEKGRVTNNDLGMVLMGLREVDAARKVFTEDLRFAEELKDELLISRVHYNLAQLAVLSRNFDEAIASYKKCVEMCKSSDNTELLLRTYNGLGNIFHIKGELDESIAYYERGLALHDRAGDPRGGAAISVNIGIIESSRKKFDAALDSLIPAIEFLKGLPDKTAGDLSALARGLLEFGDIQRQQGDLDSAVETLNQGYDMAVTHESVATMRFWILSTLAEVAIAKNDEKQLKWLLAQMRPITNTPDEKERLAEVEKSMSVDGSVGAAQEVSTKEGEAKEPAPAPAPAKVPPEDHPYERVLEINKLMNAERSLDYVLKTVVYHAIELTGAESGAVILIDDDGALSVASQRNMEGREDDIKFSTTLARRVIEAGEPIITDSAAQDERFSSEESVILNELNSIMCLPVIVKGKTIGVLYLDHRFAVNAFADVDMKLVDAFTDQVGLAIENARLVAELYMRESKLEQELSTASVKIGKYEEMLGRGETLADEGAEAEEETVNYRLLKTESPSMKKALDVLDKVADTDLSVLIVGESGVGKELIARALHDNHSARREKSFVAISCGAIPENLMESELFGYKKGAFTGAHKDKRGLIEEAEGGTLFFDEMGELELGLQVKLLRVLQEREFVPVGGTKPIPCDIRVLAATNRDLEHMVKEGTFRDDLFYRLCQIKVVVPPLRKRQEDIPYLTAQFVVDASGESEISIHPSLMKRLVDYPWPGNIRELQNLIHVACTLTEGESVTMESVPKTSAFAHYFEGEASASAWPQPVLSAEDSVSASLSTIPIDERNAYDPDKTWRDYQRIIIAKAYQAAGFNATKAAADLGIALATLYKKIKEWELKDHTNAVYREPFVYADGKKLDDYTVTVFKAALTYANDRPMGAIANLHVSQGYFYKIMKRM